jgi:glycosyltransferase involved in cell wall biosynthesis
MIDANGKPLKVMMFSTEYPPDIIGGLGTHVFELATGLGRAGIRLNVLALTPHESRTRSDAEVSVHLIARNSLRAESSGNFEMYAMLREVFRFNDALVSQGQRLIEAGGDPPDLIHCHEWFTVPAAIKLRELFGVPIVCTIHLLHDPLTAWYGQEIDPEISRLEKQYYPQPDRLITVSHSMAALIQATHQIEAERIHVIHNGCDLQLFAQPPLKPAQVIKLRQTIAAEDEKIVLYAGRITPQKGITALYESAALVVARFPRVRYLIVGDFRSFDAADTIQRLEQRFPQLQPHIKLLGKLPRQQLAALYQVADLTLVPSIYEPFGYAAIEAMAAGVPVVATRIGGLAEIIEDGVTGLLVPVEQPPAGPFKIDIQSLVDAQWSLLRDASRARRIGKAARQSVTNRFTRETMIESTLSVYRKTVAKPGPRNLQTVSSRFSG